MNFVLALLVDWSGDSDIKKKMVFIGHSSHDTS